MPAGHDADRLRKIILEAFDMSLGTGLTKLGGKVFRIGHLGDFNDLTLMGTLAGVEMGLGLAGVPVKKEGVQAAMEYLAPPQPRRRAKSRRNPVSGPLAGVKVLELAQIMAGPTCGMMLADLGADVIKVERVPGGDDTRRMDRPSVRGESASFMAMNRNKRGIALNLKLPAAQEALKRMAAKADVVTENYRKGTMEKLGVGYEQLKGESGPDLLLVSGYGRSGLTPTRAATI